MNTEDDPLDAYVDANRPSYAEWFGNPEDRPLDRYTLEVCIGFVREVLREENSPLDYEACEAVQARIRRAINAKERT